MVCCYWGMQRVPSSKRQCSQCAREICVDSTNLPIIELKQIQLRCVGCCPLAATDHAFAIGGKIYPKDTQRDVLMHAVFGVKYRN
jgi:hypothetical protein